MYTSTQEEFLCFFTQRSLLTSKSISHSSEKSDFSSSSKVTTSSLVKSRLTSWQSSAFALFSSSSFLETFCCIPPLIPRRVQTFSLDVFNIEMSTYVFRCFQIRRIQHQDAGNLRLILRHSCSRHLHHSFSLSNFQDNMTSRLY